MMSIFDEPKIDCHNHVFDPAAFPYRPDTAYRPAGQEIGTALQFRHVMDCYGVRNALAVGPNSGYGTDSRPCSTPSRAATAAARALPWSRSTSAPRSWPH
jgi:hypothetical protein